MKLFQTYRKRIPDKIVNTTLKNLPNNIIYEFYDDHRRDKYMKTQSKKIYKLFSKLKYQAHKTDLFRYCILYEQGGIYLDADSVIVKKIDTKIFDKDCMFVYDSNCKNIFNGFIYTKKNNLIIKKVIDYMIKDDGRLFGLKNIEFDTLGHSYHFNIDFLSIAFQKYYNIRFKDNIIPYEFNNKSLTCYLFKNRDLRYLYDESGKKFLIFKNDLYRQNRY